MTLVTDSGFDTDDWGRGFTTADQLPANDTSVGLDLNSDADPETLRDHLEHLPMIRVDFPSFADGRGFTIGSLLNCPAC